MASNGSDPQGGAECGGYPIYTYETHHSQAGTLVIVYSLLGHHVDNQKSHLRAEATSPRSHFCLAAWDIC